MTSGQFGFSKGFHLSLGTWQLKQNKQIQEALEEQQKQNELFRKKNDQNLYELNQKEFQIEKDKIVSCPADLS